ncbi:MAG: ATP-binding protein [Defluviitaleaceae bacterium]|nr:ATP-binding protein [Defluviitaleaceae bacterium]
MSFKIAHKGSFDKNPENYIDFLMDRLPVACSCIDAKGNLQAVNKHWKLSFGADFMPDYQPCGTPSHKILCDHVKEALNGNDCRLDMLCLTVAGDSIFFEIILQRETDELVTAYALETNRYKKIFFDKSDDAVQRGIDDAWLIQQVHNANPIPACFWDASFNVTDCNDALVKLLEISSKEEFIANPLRFSPEKLPDGSVAVEQFSAVAALVIEKGYARFPWSHQTVSGELIPGDATVIRIDIKDTYIFATYFQDLRPLMNATEKIHEAEEQLRFMIDATPIAVTIYDKEGIPISCNEEVLRMFGDPSEEAFINNFSAIMIPIQPDGQNSSELLNSHISQAFDDGYAHIGEMIFRKPDESLVKMEMTFMRILHKNDYVVIEYCRDITEQSQAEELNKQFLNAAPFAIILLDENFYFVSCNHQAVEMTGYSNIEDLTEHLFKLMPEYQPDGMSSQKIIDDFAAQAMEHGIACREFIWIRADGQQVPTEVTWARIKQGGKFMIALYISDLRSTKASIEKEKKANEITQLLLDTSPALVEIWDSDFNFVECNQRTLDMFDCKNKEEYIQKYLETMPELQPCGTLSIEMGQSVTIKAFSEGSIRYEWLRRLPNGQPLHLEVNAFSIERDGKRLLISYSNDLRQIKASLEIEREQAIMARIQLMFDATPLCIEYWDKDLRPLYCNQTTLDYYEFTNKDDYTNRMIAMAEAHNEQDGDISSWSIWDSELKKILETGFGSFQYIEQSPSQGATFVKVEGRRMKFDDEDVIVTYSQDITQLIENEKAIEQAREIIQYREKLLNAVNHTAEVLLASDEENTSEALIKGMELVGRCASADRVQIWHTESINNELYFVMRYQWLSEAGKQKSDVPIGLAITYKDRAEWLEMFKSGKRMNTPVSKMKPKDIEFLDHYGALSVASLPLFLNNELVGFISIDDCCNERVFTDDEMDMFASVGLMFASVFNRNLQSETIAETNRQLALALDQALSASRAKSNFLSTMSHEMRTPMNAIIGMATIAKKSAASEDKNAAVDKVQKAAHHLLGIINDVLDMSRIEANKLELSYNKIDIRSTIQNIISLVEPAVEEKSHNFIVNVDENVPSLHVGDNQRLTQILTNLLTNAAVYTPEGGQISLDVSFVGESSGTRELRFEVADNGIGIPPELQDKLFESFERADSSTSRKYGGTGLGLPISKRLTELMDGTIHLESEVGKGSKFIFTVKLAIPDSSMSSSQSADDSTQIEYTDFAGKKLLLAEDMEINAEILIALLDGTGLIIDVAKNGREAVTKVTANPDLYDLIFMDMQMPEMDGLEATRQIREIPHEAAKQVPIIAMTANVFTDDIENCLEVGMNDHIGKPLDMGVVFEKLKKYL